MKRFAKLLKGEQALNEEQQLHYRLLSPARQSYRRLRTELVETNYQWQMDLAGLKKLRGYNHVYRYLQ